MALNTALVLNIATIVLISLYAFGGDTPIVSLMTVTAGVSTQLYCYMANVVVSRVVQPHQKEYTDVDSEWSCSGPALTARNGILNMLSYLATVVKSHHYQQLGFVLALLVVGRLLQMVGLMTPWSGSQASPLAFVLGITIKRALPDDAKSEDDTSVAAFFSESVSLAALKPQLTLAKENPYNLTFWSELEIPVSSKDALAKVSLEPSVILSDLYHRLILA